MIKSSSVYNLQLTWIGLGWWDSWKTWAVWRHDTLSVGCLRWSSQPEIIFFLRFNMISNTEKNYTEKNIVPNCFCSPSANSFYLSKTREIINSNRKYRGIQTNYIIFLKDPLYLIFPYEMHIMTIYKFLQQIYYSLTGRQHMP